ncbi:hypothetical protein DH2020_019276 [Rehmannia glutinosa]|uniref:Uncharacterized protein n=1 Tax=Rehmannia glutinosa TaxID=99300 RepID=A0ABR0WPT8_REHGL
MHQNSGSSRGVVRSDVSPGTTPDNLLDSENEAEVDGNHVPVHRDPPRKIQKDHPTSVIIGEVSDPIRTRRKERTNYRAMVRPADALNGFRRKKFWFPCKYFSLNALSLTLLAVAMKLPMDHNTNIPRNGDTQLPKHSSLVFISTAMSNFMSSLGSMNDKELLANVVALGILVITIVGNMLIQIVHLGYYVNDLFATTSMLLLLLTLVASAITVPTIKRGLESKYREKHKVALIAELEVVQRNEAFKIDNKKGEMMKYWVMAKTSSPQFVMVRSVVCTTSTLIPLLPVIALETFIIEAIVEDINWLFGSTPSVYGRYTKLILSIQTIGVIVGLIAPTFRWFIVVGFKCSKTNHYSFRKEFKIETHWIQTLVDWRDGFSATQIWQDKCTKFFHDAKWSILTIFIGVQIFIVLLSKFIVFAFVSLIRPIFLCFTYTKKFMMWLVSIVLTSNNHGNIQSGDDDTDLNISRYVLVLEGEAELPRWIHKNIYRRVENMIKQLKSKNFESLINFLHKFDNFNGVGLFDTNQIPSLHSQGPPNYWTLPVVTLTSIAIAHPNIAKEKREHLASVGEGMSLAKIVEKTFNTNVELLNIRKAANVSWTGIGLYRKWLELIPGSSTDDSILSPALVEQFLAFAKAQQANSTVNLSHDIPHSAATTISGTQEKWEKSVHEAFLLLGKTKQILELIQQHEWPFLNHDKSAYIDEWRAFLCPYGDDSAASASTSSNEIVVTPVSGEKRLAITVDC